MLVAYLLYGLALVGSALEGEDDRRVKPLLKGDSFTVTWEKPGRYDERAELEIGFGYGHGGSLYWMRFVPGRDGVEVLEIAFGLREAVPAGSLVVTRGRMTSRAYGVLLRDIARVRSARLEPVSGKLWTAFADFWVQVRLTDPVPGIDWDWAGYHGSLGEIKYAKPKAVVALVRDAVEGIAFKPHTLTDADRVWASAKFVRDWDRTESNDGYWWVHERALIMIGLAGDASALPTLNRVLDNNRKDRYRFDARHAFRKLLLQTPRVRYLHETEVEWERREFRAVIEELKFAPSEP
jgi:hypothetical protein